MSSSPQLIGQTLGHYRIIEQIGAGGMGVVYRAHDEQLDRDVAAKVLPVGILADEAARKRFRKEALSLAKLNHPNIATIFEFSTQNSTDYLVTEYISGLSLDHKLDAGALSEKEVITLGIQLAQGLGAAHEQGIVHRDLKPANLRLTCDGRLKILDFGLAQFMPRAREPALTATLTLTQLQGVTGTLLYMAPEQLRGEPAGAGTDIWAAGAVLYEMATAHPPFGEKVPTALAGDILHKFPVPPRSLRPELSPKLEAVILKCLEKEAAKRYQSARELQTDLETLSTGMTPIASRWLSSSTAITAIVVFALFCVAASWYLLRKRESGSTASAIRARRSVAVLGFKNLSGRADEAWLATALSEMLTTELAAGAELRTIPGEDVARMKISLSLSDSDSYGRETLARIRKNIRCDDVVLGSYLALGGGQLRLDLRLEDAAMGEVVDSVTQTGNEAELADLVSRTGKSLRAKLGVGEISAGNAGTVAASLPGNPRAAQLYSEGLAKLRTYEDLAARNLLQKAVFDEPNFPLAHSALSRAWARLGYAEKAKEEAKRAFDLSKTLSWEDGLMVEAQYRVTRNEITKAEGIYHKLFDFFPDNVDYGLRLANVLISAGKPKEALITIEMLRKLPLPDGDDPRIDLAEAGAAERLGDHKRQRAAAGRAAEKAKAEGAKLFLADASWAECLSLRDLGSREQMMSFCEEAKRLYAQAGDRNSVARVLNDIAWDLRTEGDLVGAKARNDEALSVFREIGNKYGIIGALNARGTVLLKQGDLAGAANALDEAMAVAHETEDKPSQAVLWGNHALVLRAHGDLARAQREFEKAVASQREIGDREFMANGLIGIGSVQYYWGELAVAKKTLGEALSILREAGNKRYSSTAHVWLGGILWAEGDLAGARTEFQQALQLREEDGEKVAAAECVVALADISTDEGHPGDVYGLIHQALSDFQARQLADDQVWAETVLARALLAQGKAVEAQRLLTSVSPMAVKSQNRDVRLDVAIVAARVDAAVGKVPQARRHLQATLAEATKYNFESRKFEARLALGETEIRSGYSAAGRARMAALEKDATEKGFLLIARKANTAAKRTA